MGRPKKFFVFAEIRSQRGQSSMTVVSAGWVRIYRGMRTIQMTMGGLETFLDILEWVQIFQGNFFENYFNEIQRPVDYNIFAHLQE